MQIKGIYDLNQVFGFEVYQDQKQPREKRTNIFNPQMASTTTLVEDEFFKPLF